jgi:arsenite methyltransferase
MNIKFTADERKKIEDGIANKYARVAANPEGHFTYPTGRAGLTELKYDPVIVRSLPPAAVDSYCGVGNPFSLGPIYEGEKVLDIGCGGGLDTMIAAQLVGPSGRVVGIDIGTKMLERARQNLQDSDLENVTFQEAGAEDLPFPDQSFDVVISNGVFNLVPGKAKALAEVFRVLKPGGRVMMADQFLVGDLPKDPKAKIASWAN